MSAWARQTPGPPRAGLRAWATAPASSMWRSVDGLGDRRAASRQPAGAARRRTPSSTQLDAGRHRRRHAAAGLHRFAGPSARARISAASRCSTAARHADTTLVVDPHGARIARAASSSSTSSTTRRPASTRARSIVAPGAQKTDGKMKSKALLPGRRRQHEQQAGARDLRRRRGLRPRRDGRRARRGPAVLSAGARHPAARGRGACCSRPSPTRRIEHVGDRASCEAEMSPRASASGCASAEA